LVRVAPVPRKVMASNLDGAYTEEYDLIERLQPEKADRLDLAVHCGKIGRVGCHVGKWEPNGDCRLRARSLFTLAFVGFHGASFCRRRDRHSRRHRNLLAE